MNIRDDNDNHDVIGDELRWALRGLRRDTPPEHDLWPAIAARIAASPATAQPARPPHRFAPLALAASLLLAVGIAWRLQAPVPAPATEVPSADLLGREAQAMTREYDAALHELRASAPQADAPDPAMRELDRSAAQIRSALRRDPDARFLLDRLRHTYSLRLALTQRAALS